MSDFSPLVIPSVGRPSTNGRIARWVQCNGSTSQTTHGDVNNVVGTAAADAQTSTTPQGQKLTSGSVSGNGAYLSGSTHFRAGRRNYFLSWCKLNQTTVLRAWHGYTTVSAATLYGVDDTTMDFAGFRYSTAVPDATWKACLKDGTTLNAINTGVTPDTNWHKFEVEESSAGVWTFKIDGAIVASSSTNAPRTSQTLLPVTGIATLEAVAKDFSYVLRYHEADM